MSASEITKGNTGKQADKGASGLDKLAEGAIVDQSKVFKLPAGLLNSFEPPIAIVDRAAQGGLGGIKTAIRKSNSVDTITGLSQPKGIVLRIENPAADQSTGGILDTMLTAVGLTPEKPLKQAKVLVPGIHGRILKRPDGPGDPNYPNSKNANDRIIDLYPTFTCVSNDPIFDAIEVGDVVSVEFPSKNNFTTSGAPLIVSVLNQGLPPASVQTGCNDTNVYQSSPPAGNPLPAGQRASGHTGKDGAALRSRKKRAIAQYFAHKSAGSHLLENVSSMISSKGYSLSTETSPGAKVSKKEINKDLTVYQHTATLAELIEAEGAFSKNTEMIVITFRKVHNEPIAPAQEEKYRIRSIITSLIQTIDSRTGGQPMINLIADIPQSQFQSPNSQILNEAFNTFLPNDPDFSSFININRVKFITTLSSYESSQEERLSPNGSALFTQTLMKNFSVPGSDPSPVENKKPGPEALEAKKPASPSGYMASQMLLDMLERETFPAEPGLAKQFLQTVAKRLKLDNIEALQSLEPDYVNLTMDGVIDILDLQQSLSPDELTKKRDQIIAKIKAAKARKEKDDKSGKSLFNKVGGFKSKVGNAAARSGVPFAGHTPTFTQPNASCGVMTGGNATTGARSYPSVSNSFLEGSESGSDMAIPNISPAPPKDFKLAKKAKTKAHLSVGKGITLPAGLETGGKIPMKFSNASDFPVYHGLMYTRSQAKKAGLHPMETKSTDFTAKTVRYLKISGGIIDPNLKKRDKKTGKLKGPNAKPTTKIVARALNAFNAAWEEIHKCPAGKNFMYGPGDANQSYQFIVASIKGRVKGVTKRYFGHKTATAAIDNLISQGHTMGDILGPTKKRSRLGLSHVSGVGFDLRSNRNEMTKKRLKPTKSPTINRNADPNWWKSQYNIDVNSVINQTPEGSNKTYELAPMDHPACITKILKKYGFRAGLDYGSHKSKALADAMHYEFFGDPRVLDQIKAKSFAAGPKSPKGKTAKA